MSGSEINDKAVADVAKVTQDLKHRAHACLLRAAEAGKKGDTTLSASEAAKAVAYTEVYGDLMSILR